MGDTGILQRRGIDKSSMAGERWRQVHRGWAMGNLSQSLWVCAAKHSLYKGVAALGLLCAYRSRIMRLPVIIFNCWFFVRPENKQKMGVSSAFSSIDECMLFYFLKSHRLTFNSLQP